MKTQEQIGQWIQTYLAKMLEVDPEEVDRNYEFERFGMSSSAAVSLVGDLEEWLNIEISPALFFEFTTIDQVSAHLHQVLREEVPEDILRSN
jgi:acyl carrier protein